MAKRIPLKGGVDLRSPRSRVREGFLADCFNYEVDSIEGYRPIDGFERFDGHMSPSNRDIWDLVYPDSDAFGSWAANHNLSWTLGTESGDVGIIISKSSSGGNTTFRIAHWTATDSVPDGATITNDAIGNSITYVEANATWTALEDVATDAGDYFDQLNAAADVLRGAIGEVPGSGTVHGVKRYAGDAYAVRDFYSFNYTDGDIAEPHLDQHVVITDGATSTLFGDEGIVRELRVDSGSFSLGTGAGVVVIEPLTDIFDFSTKLSAFENQLMPLAELYFSSGSEEPSQGDQLTGQTSTNDAYVFRVELFSGAWADGDAEGVIYCYDVTGELTDGENFDNADTTTTNVLTGDFSVHGAGGQVLTYSSANTDGHDRAGLYQSSRTGWQKVDLGYEIRFDTGTNEPTPVKFGAATEDQTVATTAYAAAETQRDLGGWAPSAGSELDAVSASGGAYVNVDDVIGHLSLKESQFYFAVHNFGIELPVGARVVGIEIKIRAKNTAAATDGAALTKIQPFLNDTSETEGGYIDGVIAKRQAVGDLTASFVDYTFGGANDLWGTSLTRDDVQSSSFGVKFKMEWDEGPLKTTMQVDQVAVRVHYVEQGSLIYFYDTVAMADYTTARLINLHVEDGDWASNDAVGIMHIYDLQRSQLPTQNIQIRDTAAGAGNLIANLDGIESRVYLPGTALLTDQDSKYQMITGNVYARDDLEALYGCSGAGPAFSYDGFYVRFHRSGLSPDLDIPRHVALFQFRLWLAYKWGEIAASIAGDPISFDGTLNAVAGGVGHRITGLSPLSGQTLAVFTDKAIFGINVSGSDFAQQTISPKAGALEYSIQDIGNTPLFADQRGITTAAISEKYGNFETGRLSTLVSKWLLPRLQGVVVDSNRDKRLVNTTVSPEKNQYRMYFADGWRLSLTLGGEFPEATFQKLYTGGTESQFIRILSTDSDADTKGPDRAFFTMDVNPNYDHGSAIGYVYEDNRGTSFDGDSYTYWAELGPIYGNSSVRYKWFNAIVHLFGEAHGHAQLSLSWNYNNLHPADAESADPNGSLTLGASTESVRTETDDYETKARMQGRGKRLSLRIQGSSEDELPHILQELFILNEKTARLDT